jgi:hypothetical protein
MKNEIDNLVTQIKHALKEEDEPVSQLDPLLNSLSMKGINKAIMLRTTLENHVNDLGLPQEIRDYANNKLKELATF